MDGLTDEEMERILQALFAYKSIINGYGGQIDEGLQKAIEKLQAVS